MNDIRDYEAEELENKLESVVHNLFIDTLINIDNTVKANSILDYVPNYVYSCDKLDYYDKMKCEYNLYYLIGNKVYVDSLVNYISSASGVEYDYIVYTFGNRENLVEDIVEACMMECTVILFDILNKIKGLDDK